jgi:hypothetical protein
MRVNILSIPGPVQAASTPSLAAGSRSPSFSDAMARTSQAESVQTASEPTRLLPTTKSASESSLPAQPSQAVRAGQLAETGVRSDAAKTNCEMQSSGALSSRAGAQAAPQATPKTAASATLIATPMGAPGANKSSANAGARANARAMAQLMALPIAKDALSNTVIGIPEQQVSPDAASVITSLVLPTPLFVAVPEAALPTSTALPVPGAPSVGATSTATRGPAASTVSAPVPSLAAFSVAAPTPASPLLSTTLASSAIASVDQVISAPDRAFSQSSAGKQDASSANKTVANGTGQNLPTAHSPSPSSNFTAQSSSRVPAEGWGAPPPMPPAPVPAANVAAASDAGSGTARPQIPGALDDADALLRDAAGATVGANATVDNVRSFDHDPLSPVSNAAVGDVPQLRSETVSLTAALPVAGTAATDSGGTPIPSPVVAGTKADDTSPASKTLPLSFGDASVRIATPAASGPQLSSTTAGAVQHPAPSRNADSAADGSIHDATPATTLRIAAPVTFGAQPPAMAANEVQASTVSRSNTSALVGAIRDSVPAAPNRDSIKTASSPTPGTATTQAQSVIDASVSPASIESIGGPTANSLAIGTVPSSSANFVADSPAPVAASTVPAKDPTNAGQPASSANAAASSSPGQKPAGASRITASAAASSTTPSSSTPATGTAADPALVAPAPQQTGSSSATSEKAGATSELPAAHRMLDSAPLPAASETLSGSSAGHFTPDSSTLQMQVGVHTSAFGNVEVHTVIEQSQVGISIHGDRELARWFNSEVSGLEAGLKNQHLNLTGVDFSSTRSGVQTATSFQQGQPRQNFSQTSGSCAAASPTDATATESTTETDLTTALPARGPETRVSILV